METLETSFRVINGASSRLEDYTFDATRLTPVVHLQMWEKLGYSYVPRPGGETYAPVSSLLSLLDLTSSKGAQGKTEAVQAVEVAQLKQELREANSRLEQFAERIEALERARTEAEERQRQSLAVLTT
jgi:hypothetical protein